MSTEHGTASNPIQQAELILHLYELRREPVMRLARSYIGGEFMPKSADDFVRIVSAGDQHTSFVLQVYGYWDMVAAFTQHGALNPELVYDTCQEMYFQYAKIQPFLPEFRREMDMPEFLRSIERLIEGSEAGRERVRMMRKSLSAIAGIRSEADRALP